MAIPKPPLNAVESVTIDYNTLVARAGGGVPEPYPVYTFANGRKRFYDNLQPNSIYDKPVSIAGGITTHLSDPSLVSTTDPEPSPTTVGTIPTILVPLFGSGIGSAQGG